MRPSGKIYTPCRLAPNFTPELPQMPAAFRSLSTTDNFLILQRQYTQQYSHIYFCRLKALRSSIESAARLKWPTVPVAEKMTEFPADGQRCIVIGTIYVENPSKPNILDEVALELHLKNRTSHGPAENSLLKVAGNTYLVEDEFGRCQLELGGCSQREVTLMTGVSVALLGFERASDGVFCVEDVCAAGVPAQPPARPRSPIAVAMLCGVSYGSDATLDAQLVMHQLTSTPLDCILVVGSVLREPPQYEDTEQRMRFGAINYRLDTTHFSSFSETIKWTLQENNCDRIVLVPGLGDPTNASIPQQPIPVGIFPGCHRYWEEGRLVLATNPALFLLDQVRFLVLPSQSVNDAKWYTGLDSLDTEAAFQVIATILRCRHLAPTAPDSICCYPSFERDPFVLAPESSFPQVVVCGGQAEFAYRQVEGIHVILLPDFLQSRQSVVARMDASGSLDFRKINLVHRFSDSHP